MDFKDFRDTVVGVEEIISTAKAIGLTNVTLQGLDDQVKKEFTEQGYEVYDCTRPRIGGHTKFIRLTMIDWSHMEVAND